MLALNIVGDLAGLLLGELAAKSGRRPLGKVLVEGLRVVLGLGLLGGGGGGLGALLGDVLLALVLGAQLSLALLVGPVLGGGGAGLLLGTGGTGGTTTATTVAALGATGASGTGGTRTGASVRAVLTGALGVAVTALVVLLGGS